jgi:hypothetical protein
MTKKSPAQLQREIDEALAGRATGEEDEAERIAQAEYAEQRRQRQRRAAEGEDWRKHESATNYEDKFKFWNAYAKRWGLAAAIKRAREVAAGNFLGRDFGETAASFYARSPAAKATSDWLKGRVT